MNKRHIIGGVLAACVVVAVGIEFYSIQKTAQIYQQLESEFSQHTDALIQDQVALNSEPFFQQTKKSRDAGVFLNSRIRWRDIAQEHLTSSDALLLPEEIASEIMESQEDWEKLKKIDLSKVNLNWMSKLQEFDYWDLYATGPAAKYMETHPEYNPFELPGPNNLVLTLPLAIARLLKGISEQKGLQALREVRALARLLFSHDFLTNELVAIGILRIERSGYQEMLRAKLIKAGDWSPIEESVLSKAVRVVRASGSMLNMAVPDESLRKFFLDRSFVTVGTCLAVTNGIIGLSVHRPYFKDDFLSRSNLIDQIIQKYSQVCLLSGVRKFIEKSYSVPTNLTGNVFRDWMFVVGVHVPYLRLILGYQMFGWVVDANPFRGYKVQ